MNPATVEGRQASVPRNIQSFTNTADGRRGNPGLNSVRCKKILYIPAGQWWWGLYWSQSGTPAWSSLSLSGPCHHAKEIRGCSQKWQRLKHYEDMRHQADASQLTFLFFFREKVQTAGFIKQGISSFFFKYLVEKPRLGPYQSGHSEVSGMHLLSQPVHFPPCVDEYDRLCDGQGLVEVTQRVQLPLLRTNTR